MQISRTKKDIVNISEDFLCEKTLLNSVQFSETLGGNRALSKHRACLAVKSRSCMYFVLWSLPVCGLSWDTAKNTFFQRHLLASHCQTPPSPTLTHWHWHRQTARGRMGPLHILAATLLATGDQRQIEHKEAGKTACQLAPDWLRERVQCLAFFCFHF